MSLSASPAEPQVIVDTVVVNYFLVVGRFEVLRRVLGGAVQVPRAVFDPDEDAAMRDEALSELRRGLRFHQRRSTDLEAAPELRDRSKQALQYFRQLPGFAQRRHLVTVTLSAEEMRMYARLRSADYVKRFRLVAGLGAGEAAAVAIAASRSWRLATDDQDGIRVAQTLVPGFEPLRIRGLLKRGIDSGLLSASEAHAIHVAMLAMGLWDTGHLS
jgi:predicted nucleic acid-binding protein